MSDSSSTSSGTAVAVGATLAVVLTLLICGSLFLYIRRRRATSGVVEHVSVNAGRHSQVLDRSHPASRVTPWAPDSEALRFTHRPGEDMRVAHRRSDGGWEFSEPLTLTIKPSPFTSELSPTCPSPTSSIATSTLFRKEKKLPGELTTRGFVEADSEGLPPPAYTPQ